MSLNSPATQYQDARHHLSACSMWPSCYITRGSTAARIWSGAWKRSMPRIASKQRYFTLTITAMFMLIRRRTSAFAASGNSSNRRYRRQRLPKCHHLALPPNPGRKSGRGVPCPGTALRTDAEHPSEAN